jgi:hypothetical protein
MQLKKPQKAGGMVPPDALRHPFILRLLKLRKLWQYNAEVKFR